MVLMTRAPHDYREKVEFVYSRLPRDPTLSVLTWPKGYQGNRFGIVVMLVLGAKSTTRRYIFRTKNDEILILSLKRGDAACAPSLHFALNSLRGIGSPYFTFAAKEREIARCRPKMFSRQEPSLSSFCLWPTRLLTMVFGRGGPVNCRFCPGILWPRLGAVYSHAIPEKWWQDTAPPARDWRCVGGHQNGRNCSSDS